MIQKFTPLGWPHNQPSAADGIEILVVMPKSSAAAD